MFLLFGGGSDDTSVSIFFFGDYGSLGGRDVCEMSLLLMVLCRVTM